MSQILQKIKDGYYKLKVDHSSYIKEGIRPTRDWGTILICTSIIMCVMLFSEFYFYTLVKQEKLFGVIDDDFQKEVKINNDILVKVVGDINAREVNMIKIKEGKLTQPDPSI